MLFHNPKKYRELLAPFATRDEAAAAMEAFFADVELLRDKYRIVTMAAIIEVNVVDATDPDLGGEVAMNASVAFGNLAKAPLLAAILYGTERERLEEHLDQVAERSRKRRK